MSRPAVLAQAKTLPVITVPAVVIVHDPPATGVTPAGTPVVAGVGQLETAPAPELPPPVLPPLDEPPDEPLPPVPGLLVPAGFDGLALGVVFWGLGSLPEDGAAACL